MPISYFLRERAFAPALLPPIHPNWFQELYGEEAPEYGSTLSKGTVSTLDDFTLEEKEVLAKLNRQFNLLIEIIRSECIRLRINDDLDGVLDDFAPEEKIDLLNNLNNFSSRYSNRIFYANEGPLFYSQVKQDIEIIAFNLLHNSLLHDVEKKRTLQYLLQQIIYCAGGVLGHLDTAKMNLSRSETLDAWLAKFRLTLIQQLASDYVRQNRAHAGYEIHIGILFLKYATAQGWNPYGFEVRSKIEDPFERMVSLLPYEWEAFKEDFSTRYNPSVIMEELATHLHYHLRERLQKKDSPYAQEEDHKTIISLPKLPDFKKFFEDLPLVTDPASSLYDMFSPEPLGESSLFFKLGDECLYLKSIPELKRSMMEIFIKTNINFFEIYHDEYYTLVPHSPDLCYQHNLEKPPLETSLKAFAFLKEHRVKLTHALFSLFYENNVRDFSDCTLHDVDFSKCDIQALNLKRSRLYFQKEITPDQFISLFKCGAIITFFTATLLGHIEFVALLQETIGNSPEDKGILLTYGVLINSPEFISRLLAIGADATLNNFSSEETAIMQALRFRQWECVKVLSRVKTPKDPFVLVSAAEKGQWDIVEILLETGTDPNLSTDPEEETALHFAVHNNKACLVEKLLAAGADPSLKTYTQEETALDQAIAREYHECVQLLQNADIKKLSQLIKKPLFPPSIKNPHPFFLSFYENQFPPSIKNSFFRLCGILRNDSFTSPLTKKTITDHFISLLKGTTEKDEEKEYEEKEENETILDRLYQSRKSLKSKLTGKPPLSNELTTAITDLFESIFPEGRLWRMNHLPPIRETVPESPFNPLR